MSAGPEFNETAPSNPGGDELTEMTKGDPSSPEPTDATKTVGIVIADDHAVVRRGLKQILGAEPGFKVLAEASDVDDARRYVRGHHPDVLVLDLNLPGGSSLKHIPAIRSEFPDTQIVVLTMQNEPAYAREALSAGALGYVLKEAAETELRGGRSQGCRRRHVPQPTARCPGRSRAAAGSAGRPV